jgi:hypothetical protein
MPEGAPTPGPLRSFTQPLAWQAGPLAGQPPRVTAAEAIAEANVLTWE